MTQNSDINSETHLTDEEIIDLYWKRDEKAIAETDQKYGKYLYAIAYNIIRDSLDCEECLNDTYLGTWNQIPPTRPNVLQAFLARIMRNIAVDRYRENTASKRIPSELMVSLSELNDCMSYQISTEDRYVLGEICKLLVAYLRGLPSRSEFIFMCRYYYSDRIADIARMLDISENTVYRELRTIRNGFKECLEKEGYSL